MPIPHATTSPQAQTASAVDGFPSHPHPRPAGERGAGLIPFAAHLESRLGSPSHPAVKAPATLKPFGSDRVTRQFSDSRFSSLRSDTTPGSGSQALPSADRVTSLLKAGDEGIPPSCGGDMAAAKPKTAPMSLDKMSHNSRAPEKEKVAEASRQFESMMIRQILNSAHLTFSATGKKTANSSESIYQDMITSSLADKMTASGGFGLATTLQAQMDREGKAVPRRTEFAAIHRAAPPKAAESKPVGPTDLMAR